MSNFAKKKVVWISSIFASIFLVFGTWWAFNNRSKIVRNFLKFTRENIYVSYSTDSNYIFPTLVSMTSLMDNADDKTFCRFYILHNEISDSDKDKLNSVSRKYKNCSIYLIDVRDEFSSSYEGGWSKAMYFRLLLPDILKKQKRCIYLDGDTIVRHDLREMFKTDIDDFYVAGVRDFNGYINKGTDYYKNLGIDNLDTYICSGVMLMNLDKIRNNNVIPKLRELVAQNDIDKKFVFPDQDAINKGCYKYIKPFPFKFGALTHTINTDSEKSYIEWIKSSQDEFDKMKNDPTVVHFTGGKPWNKIYDNVKQFCYEWREYAGKTDYMKEISEKYHI